jgi:CheY-like chemotaxis protein
MSISILLVEDSPTQAAMSKFDLETLAPDVVVEVAMTAAKALSRLQNPIASLPDLVILDMTLPDGNGLDLCRSIKVNPRTRGLPVVVFSVEAFSKHRQEAYAAGADHYISKGGTGDTTLKLVASTLLRRKLRQLPRLGEALIAKKYIKLEQLQEALNIQARNPSKMLGQILMELKYITPQQLTDTLEAQRKGEA